ncbi:MAG TPA: hypothetical protein VI306_08790 [Pyrinomonadaceae bacterium]
MTHFLLAFDMPPVSEGSGSIIIALGIAVIAIAAVVFWLIRRKR